MQVGCYSLDLYCDNQLAHKNLNRIDTFTGPNKTSCNRKAKRAGWKVGKKDLCPDCYSGRSERKRE